MTSHGRQLVTEYDFRKPTQLPSDLLRPLKEWQERACRLLPDALFHLLGIEVQWHVRSSQPVRRQ